MQVIVSIRQVYGKEAIYPVNASAEQFAAIAGAKTLTRAVLARIQELGFEIVVQAPTL